MEQYAMHVDSRNRGMELVTSWVLVSDYTGLKLCCFKKPSDEKKIQTNEGRSGVTLFHTLIANTCCHDEWIYSRRRARGNIYLPPFVCVTDGILSRYFEREKKKRVID